ncbi:hypothetical protein H2280_08235, partial [Campylobacter sp. 2457A]|nr:hypothetical protein [Campylobacter sp. 2457A]
MNESIYGSLEFYSKETQSIPSDKRDLGVFGDVAPYALGLTEGSATKAFEKGIMKFGIKHDSPIATMMHYKIIMNFGILNFFLAKAEGKSNVRALSETGVSVFTSIIMNETPIGKTIEKYSEFVAKQTLTQTSRVASSAATKIASSRVASSIAARVGVSILSRIATGAATGAAIGSGFPIVGTVVGAVVGTLIAGFANDLIFGDEDKKLKEQEAEEKYLEEKLDEKMHKIIN